MDLVGNRVAIGPLWKESRVLLSKPIELRFVLCHYTLCNVLHVIFYLLTILLCLIKYNATHTKQHIKIQGKAIQ